MPVIRKEETTVESLGPGVDRWTVVDGSSGTDSLSVGDLTLQAEGAVRTHIHPTEEAMVILEGELDAVLGDEVIKVKAGDTVLAPTGVKHGFINRSGASARLMAIFPTATIERTFVD